jgi:hypothetical protein
MEISFSNADALNSTLANRRTHRAVYAIRSEREKDRTIIRHMDHTSHGTILAEFQRQTWRSEKVKMKGQDKFVGVDSFMRMSTKKK